MSKNIYAGTKTEKNLWEAFAGESQARNKYTYFASVAKKAGYEQIAELFLKTAAHLLGTSGEVEMFCAFYPEHTEHPVLQPPVIIFQGQIKDCAFLNREAP